jgi:hypothetical protein
MRAFTIEDPIYSRRIVVLQGATDAAAMKYLERDGWIVDEETTEALAFDSAHQEDARTLWDGAGLIVMRFNRHLKANPEDAALAAHEALHVVTFLFAEMLKHDFAARGDEPMAYYLGFLVRACLAGGKPTRPRKGKKRALRLKRVA